MAVPEKELFPLLGSLLDAVQPDVLFLFLFHGTGWIEIPGFHFGVLSILHTPMCVQTHKCIIYV